MAIGLRSKRLRRVAGMTVGLGALGVIAILAWPRADRIDPAPVAAVAPAAPVCKASVPTWTLDAPPLERIGYREGHAHVFDVVRLGPTAIEVEVSTARAFLTMRAAAAEACIDLGLESGFRTLEQQRVLFRAWRKGRGNKAARPGMSNHQSGRALDISVGAAPGSLAWLEANAASFGFKRTVKNEPWHWEYVESPIARSPKPVARKPAKTVIGDARRPARHQSAVAKPARSRIAASSPRH